MTDAASTHSPELTPEDKEILRLFADVIGMEIVEPEIADDNVTPEKWAALQASLSKNGMKLSPLGHWLEEVPMPEWVTWENYLDDDFDWDAATATIKPISDQ